jgi:UPF0271 protein
LAHAGQALGLRVLGEFFADRPYDGTEVTMSGWTWRADRHGLGRGRPGRQDARGSTVDLAETVCVHADTQDAPLIMAEVRQRLMDDGHAVGRQRARWRSTKDGPAKYRRDRPFCYR